MGSSTRLIPGDVGLPCFGSILYTPPSVLLLLLIAYSEGPRPGTFDHPWVLAMGCT